MKRAGAVFAITFLMTSAVLAQVHIKESATIAPGRAKKVEVGGTNNHVLSFTLSLQDSTYDAIVVVSGPNYFKVFSSVGSVSGEIQSPVAGVYYFTPCINEGYLALYHSFDLGNCFSYYYDGTDPWGSLCGSGQSGEDSTWISMVGLEAAFATPYFSKFNLLLSNNYGYLMQGYSTSASVALQGYDDSSTTAWSSHTDPVTLTIVSGSQYVSFHRLDSQTGVDVGLGATVTTVGDSIGDFWLDADGLGAVDSLGDSIVVQAQSGTLTSENSIFLEPPYFDHFLSVPSGSLQHLDEEGIGLEPGNIYDLPVTIPDSTLIDITLDSAGMKYGTLQAGIMKGKVLTDIEWGSLSYGEFEYIADGEDPQQPTNIQIEIAVPGQNVKPLYGVDQVLPAPVIVTDTPSVASPGDTVAIIVKQRNADASLTDFSSGQKFEIGISSGENYGAILLSDGRVGGYFSNVSQPFRFIAADSVDADSVVAMVRVGTRPPMLSSTEPGGKGTGEKSATTVLQKSLTTNTISKTSLQGGMKSTVTTPRAQSPGVKSPTMSVVSSVGKGNTKSVSDVNSFSWSNFGIGEVVIEGHTILLGETKYYEAMADANDPSKLDIKELTDPGQASSDRVNAQFSVQAESGDRLGAYWEYKDEDGNPLPAGLIRLVGRYWQQGTTYKVLLTASSGSATGSIDIEVKKPSSLGTSDPWRYSIDVFNNRPDIDSICIVNGGLYGIPPQDIRGQIASESKPVTGLGYPPQYRYEPFTTQFNGRTPKQLPDSWSNSPFYVTTNMGSGDPVPYHQHTQYIPYPSSPEKVWYMVSQYSQLTSPSEPGGVILYGKRNPDGTMDFARYGYVTVQRIYNSILNHFQGDKPSPSSDDIANALNSITTYLRDQWNGGVKNGTKGLENIVAQTRIASSYGLMQMMYPTTLDRGYVEDNHHVPENLNVDSVFFPFAMKHQLFLLQKILNENPDGTTNWSVGYDNAFLQMYNGWNSKTGYAAGVIQNSQTYQPQP